jgi:hypothetical protein
MAHSRTATLVASPLSSSFVKSNSATSKVYRIFKSVSRWNLNLSGSRPSRRARCACRSYEWFPRWRGRLLRRAGAWLPTWRWRGRLLRRAGAWLPTWRWRGRLLRRSRGELSTAPTATCSSTAAEKSEWSTKLHKTSQGRTISFGSASSVNYRNLSASSVEAWYLIVEVISSSWSERTGQWVYTIAQVASNSNDAAALDVPEKDLQRIDNVEPDSSDEDMNT